MNFVNRMYSEDNIHNLTNIPWVHAAYSGRGEQLLGYQWSSLQLSSFSTAVEEHEAFAESFRPHAYGTKEDYCPGKVTGLEQYMSTNCRRRCCLKKVGGKGSCLMPRQHCSFMLYFEKLCYLFHPVPVLREPYLPVGRGEQGLDLQLNLFIWNNVMWYLKRCFLIVLYAIFEVFSIFDFF